jgi:hypothetical protein
MDRGDFGSLELVNDGVDGLNRRLPYDFLCSSCGHVTTIASERDYNFSCQCGLAYRLSDWTRR